MSADNSINEDDFVEFHDFDDDDLINNNNNNNFEEMRNDDESLDENEESEDQKRLSSTAQSQILKESDLWSKENRIELNVVHFKKDNNNPKQFELQLLFSKQSYPLEIHLEFIGKKLLPSFISTPNLLCDTWITQANDMLSDVRRERQLGQSNEPPLTLSDVLGLVGEEYDNYIATKTPLPPAPQKSNSTKSTTSTTTSTTTSNSSNPLKNATATLTKQQTPSSPSKTPSLKISPPSSTEAMDFFDDPINESSNTNNKSTTQTSKNNILDWETIVLPEVEKVLKAQNRLRQFEIDEWFRRIRTYLDKGDFVRCNSIVQRELLAGHIPPSLKTYLSVGSQSSSTPTNDFFNRPAQPRPAQSRSNSATLNSTTNTTTNTTQTTSTITPTPSTPTYNSPTPGFLPAHSTTTPTPHSPSKTPNPWQTNHHINLHKGDASASTVELLQSELSKIQSLSGSQSLGFSVEPVANELLHWNVHLSGFENETLKKQLELWSSLRHQHQLDQEAKDKQENEQVVWRSDSVGSDRLLDSTPEILLEMKIPCNYPKEQPFFRVIRPRLRSNLHHFSFLNSNDQNSNNNNNSDKMEDIQTTTTSSNSERHSISMSRTIEQSSPIPSSDSGSIIELLVRVKSFFNENAQLEADGMWQGPDDDMGYCLPTIGSFWHSLTISTHPISDRRHTIEEGGKIILPQSAFEELNSGEMNRGGRFMYGSGSFSRPRYGGGGMMRSSSSYLTRGPMVFELSTRSGRRSFCGVEEFTAPEGQVIVPNWMLKNLGATQGNSLQVRRVELPQGVFLKLQPHTADFLKVNDTKAMLEWVLRKFTVLTQGDTIVVDHNGSKFLFDVLEVKPGRAVTIVDSEIFTDFAPPLVMDESFSADLSSTPSKSNSTTTSTTTSTTPSKQESTTTPTKSGGQISGSVKSEELEVVGDVKHCDNCRRKIPSSTFGMHQLTCLRMNTFCEQCKQAVPKATLEQHNLDFHGREFCECGQELEKYLVPNHKTNDCPLRIVRCFYCPLEMPYRNRYQHAQQCGSQTDRCENCNRYVRKREMEMHLMDCLQGKATQSSRRGNEELFMCPICMIPFQEFDDLQVHLIAVHEGTMEQ